MNISRHSDKEVTDLEVFQESAEQHEDLGDTDDTLSYKMAQYNFHASTEIYEDEVHGHVLSGADPENIEPGA